MILILFWMIQVDVHILSMTSSCLDQSLHVANAWMIRNTLKLQDATLVMLLVYVSDMGVNPKICVFFSPKWMVKIMENPIVMDDFLGYPYFWKPPIYPANLKSTDPINSMPSLK